MANEVAMTVRMPPDLHAATAQAAAEELVSGSAFVRRLVQNELRRRGYLSRKDHRHEQAD